MTPDSRAPGPVKRATVTAPPGPDLARAVRDIAGEFPAIEILALRHSRWFVLGQKVAIEFRATAEESDKFRAALREWAKASGGMRSDRPIM
jgi:hypothetical protein